MGVEEGLGAAFPEVPEDWIDLAIFKLAYRQHGGSGLGFQPSEVLDMTFGRIGWFLRTLDEVRELEHKALSKAGG